MWYYARGNEQVGPLDEHTFASLAADGTIAPETLVWREGMADWAPYETTKAGAAIECIECGNHVSQTDVVHYDGQAVCASCKTVYFQRLREGGLHEDQQAFASIGTRFLALLLDSTISSIVLLILIYGLTVPAIRLAFGGEISDERAGYLGIAYIVVYGGFFTFYMTWFVGRFGATPGKMAMGIRIVRGDGSPVSYTRAFCRMLGHQLSGTILYLGYVVAFFDAEKRALHDMICDTRVIRFR